MVAVDWMDASVALQLMWCFWCLFRIGRDVQAAFQFIFIQTELTEHAYSFAISEWTFPLGPLPKIVLRGEHFELSFLKPIFHMMFVFVCFCKQPGLSSIWVLEKQSCICVLLLISMWVLFCPHWQTSLARGCRAGGISTGRLDGCAVGSGSNSAFWLCGGHPNVIHTPTQTKTTGDWMIQGGSWKRVRIFV